ncbi:MAG: TA system VapC family ribonuclease toxin [Solirubrobacteraceae bacterium]
MLLPDVNVLLAGFRADHVHHDPARAFIEAARDGDEPLGLSVIVLSAVVRLATNPRVFARPDTADAVLDYLDVLLDAPGRVISEGDHHWPRFAALCRDLRLSGNLIPDSHLAALALEQRAELITLDRGFRRYPRLRWRCLLDG